MMNKEMLYKSHDRPLAVIASRSCTDGYNMAKKFAENGYDILIAARNPSVVEEAQDFKELGVDAVSFQLDLSTKEGIQQLYSRIVATGRPVEAMIINSGISADLTKEIELAKKVLKNMTDVGRGRILFAGIDDSDEKIMVNACIDIQKHAAGSGVEVDAIHVANQEFFFKKED